MNKRSGWAKVPHGWEGLKGSKSMSEREAWLWMCSWAQNYSENENLLAPPTIEYLTSSFGWQYPSKTRRFLSKLEGLNMIVKKTVQNGTKSVTRIYIVLNHLDVDVVEKRSENGKDNKTKTKTRNNTSKKYPVPGDWMPSQDTIEVLRKERYTSADLQSKRDAFVEYWADKGTERPGWDASFRTWVRRKFNNAK